MAKFLREPLLHFLVGGAILYLFLALSGADEASEDTYVIPVNEEALLLYLQYQDKAFDSRSAKAALDKLQPDAKERLIQDYIRDEIMVREAVAYGLDNNDEVIRGRLIQKMDFILQGFTPTELSISQEELENYYSNNKQQYQEDARATFTHIFFSAEKHGETGATNRAEKLLPDLIKNKVPFEKSGEYGDRFYFLRNYANRPQKLIADHFGNEMSEQIFSNEAKTGWIGPISSTYGSHLILIGSTTPSRIPSLEEVSNLVLADIRREKLDETRRQAIEMLKEKYQVLYTNGRS